MAVFLRLWCLDGCSHGARPSENAMSVFRRPYAVCGYLSRFPRMAGFTPVSDSFELSLAQLGMQAVQPFFAFRTGVEAAVPVEDAQSCTFFDRFEEGD